MTQTDADLLTAIATPVDCPIPWCLGHRLDHGFDGEAPEGWTHSGDDETLAPFATGSLSQIGNGPVGYWIDVDLGETLSPPQLRARADELRAVAAHLDAAATRLEALP